MNNDLDLISKDLFNISRQFVLEVNDNPPIGAEDILRKMCLCNISNPKWSIHPTTKATMLFFEADGIDIEDMAMKIDIGRVLVWPDCVSYRGRFYLGEIGRMYPKYSEKYKVATIWCVGAGDINTNVVLDIEVEELNDSFYEDDMITWKKYIKRAISTKI